MSELERVPAIPSGSALLHVGPHKTGTTALQYALHKARKELLTHGVRYASRKRHDSDGPRYVTAGADLVRTDLETARRSWQATVAAMRDQSVARRIFSSETLANASDEAAAQILGELGQGVTEVVVTLRPLARIIPSQYQQFVQRGATTAEFVPWLESLFGRNDDVPTWPFWHRHQHDELVRRWADAAGVEHLTVVVLDSADHDFLPRVFERLLALPDRLLVDHGAITNRSLTAAETELIRRWHLGCDPDVFEWRLRRLLMTRTARHLRTIDPRPSDPRLFPPAWVVEEANARAARMAERIAGSGVRVIGDLGALSAVTPVEDALTRLPASIDARLAGEFAVGLSDALYAVLRKQAGRAPEARPGGTDGTDEAAEAPDPTPARRWLRR